MTRLLSYSDAPGRSWIFKEVGATLSNWGRWGRQDQRGTLNFITPERIATAARLITRRCVLLDIAALKGVRCLPASMPISPADLEAAERRQGVRTGTGDILLIRTGWRNLLATVTSRARPVSAADVRTLTLPPEPG